MNTYVANVAKNGARGTAINVLAGAGFVALMALGIWLAVYSTRFVPPVVNGVGSAAVYLGSLFTRAPAGAPATAVSTSTAPATIRLGEKEPAATQSVTKTKPIAATAGTATGGMYQIGTSTTSGTATPSGLPDLITTISSVGYFATSSTDQIALRDSFIATSTVPSGERPAVHFTIKNVGTNSTGVWRWSASIPTQTAPIQESKPQQSLNPGEWIEYWFGFDYIAANRGVQTISITANFDHTVAESNPDNNSASAKITILGN